MGISSYVWIMAIAWTPLPAESLGATVEMTSTKKKKVSERVAAQEIVFNDDFNDDVDSMGVKGVV